ncbi:MAG: TonB-dependent receptor [Chitinophagales bacterium]|nr:MAG: TonB-dependent receptor [Chitinophagales bacterium]
MKKVFMWLMVGLCLPCYAQHSGVNDTTVTLDEVVVSGYAEEKTRETSLHIVVLQPHQLEKRGSFGLTDALASVPGVNQLSTGPAITKPVIRGLYGNRILIVFSGLRFDNQQWQDEHGLGLSTIGVGKTEIIKGPLSVLYGTEAVGGVIHVMEEPRPRSESLETDVGLSVHSNTLGGTFQAGVKANYGTKWFRLRMAVDNHADYTDGNHSRILNSRFDGYYLKSTLGFIRKKWSSENHYHFSLSNFGFVFNDLNQFFLPDSRWSRAMRGPHHIVLLNILSSVNTIQMNKSVLNLNAGLQSNYRAEDEGGNELSLIMLLLTGECALKWNREMKKKTELVITQRFNAENNSNYGKRKIIPDAWTGELSLSVYLKHRWERLVLEYGVGGGGRFIKTLLTPSVNTAEKEIDPFNRLLFFGNAMAGVSFNPAKDWNLKLHIATGVRAPNLAELSSNGLHEGTYVYERGNPDMKNEQNLQAEASMGYYGNWFQMGLAGYYNYFFRYIYLQPTTEEWFGFPVYRYMQYDAMLYGGEATVALTPVVLPGSRLSLSYSGLVGKLDNRIYLPYMPAQKIEPELRYDYSSKKLKVYGFINMDFVLSQRLINPQETVTPAYRLLNAGTGVVFGSGKISCDISLSANNLLDEAYYDHLSRFKHFGLLNMGRDISLYVKIIFLKTLKNKKS